MVPEYGICCVDTVIGTITLAQFQDDILRSRLRTMIARYGPTECLVEYGAHSAETAGCLRLMAPSAVLEMLRNGEMPSTTQAVSSIEQGQYFSPEALANTTQGKKRSRSENSSAVAGDEGAAVDSSAWPPLLRAVLDGLQDGSSALVMRALGGALWQLKRSLIDYEIVSLGRFYAYVPPDDEQGTSNTHDNSHSTQSSTQYSEGSAAHSTCDGNVGFDMHPTNIFSSLDCAASRAAYDASQGDGDDEYGGSTPTTTSSSSYSHSKQDGTSIMHGDGPEPTCMTLDAVALNNLEVLQNNFDHTERGSLWAFINRARTSFGQRLLRDWLCHPLYRPSDIARRAVAVEELLGTFADEAESCRLALKGVPDLERLLTRVHANGLRKKGPQDHPDSRAILYESQNYNARKIRDFADVLSGFESVLKIATVFEGVDVTSVLLRRLVLPKEAVQIGPDGRALPVSKGGRFPVDEMRSLLTHYRQIFDEKQVCA